MSLGQDGPAATQTAPEAGRTRDDATTQATPREPQALGGATAVPAQPFSTTQAVAGSAMLLGLLLVVYAVKHKVLNRRPARPAATPEDAALLADIRELTDRLAAELDAKAARLDTLIEAADARIRALESAPRAETRLIEPKPEPRRAAHPDPSHADVYHLADQGLTVLQIAQKLDRPTGQVELILNLRKGTVDL